MAVSDERLKELAMLSQATSPSFTAGIEYALADGDPEPPTDSSDMVNVSGVLAVVVEVTLRTNPKSQTARVTIGTVTTGSIYHVTINGTDHDYTAGGGDTAADIAEDLYTDINAGAQAAYVTATWTGGNGYLDVDGDVVDSFSIETSVTGTEGGTISHVTEAQDILVDVWLIHQGQSVPHIPNGAKGIPIDTNWTERVSTAGVDYMLVLPRELDGNVTVSLGLCGLE